jgi:hypothetical protein
VSVSINDHPPREEDVDDRGRGRVGGQTSEAQLDRTGGGLAVGLDERPGLDQGRRGGNGPESTRT